MAMSPCRTLLADVNHGVEDIASCRICHDKTFQLKSTSFQRQKLLKLYSSLEHYQSLVQRQILRWCINFCKSGRQGIQKRPDFRQFVSIRVRRVWSIVVVDKVHAKTAELEGSDLSILYFEIRGCFLVRIHVGNTKKGNRKIVFVHKS